MNAATALELLIQLTLLTQKLASLMQAAHTRGTPITEEELDELAGGDDGARKMLDDAIRRAREVG